MANNKAYSNLTKMKEKSPLQLHTTGVHSKFWGHHADQVFINSFGSCVDIFADNVSHFQSAQTI